MLALLVVALAGLLAASARGQSSDDIQGVSAEVGPRAILAVLPFGTTVDEIGRVEGISPGLISATLGDVPEAQTYLDISQGNRINKNLYGSELPRLYVSDGRVPAAAWDATVDRAADAPADVVPGLLASTLSDAGRTVAAEAYSGLPTLSVIDRDGSVAVRSPTACRRGCAADLSLIRTSLSELRALVGSLGPEDLLIALAAGVSSDQKLLPAGIAGDGFDGNMTSDSTRTDGLVLTTDIAPTVLEHFDVDVPDEMNGAEIETAGDRDPNEVAELQSELKDRPDREQVAFVPLLGWLGLCAIAALVWRRPGAAIALSLLALACVWTPLILLVAAALDASELASALMVAVGAPALAVITWSALPGYRGLAVACAGTVGAYAIDVIAGSPYTALSVLGPNPGGGVRFFGIGNELEATLTPLALIGCGAWLASRENVSAGSVAAWFVGVAIIATIAFAPGRFGADVGAAIVLAAGGATAAALALGFDWRRTALTVAAAGVIGIGALVVIDLVFGGAHLSRSVLGAGEASDVLDVLDRRVTLMWNSFVHPVYPALLVVCGLLLIAGLLRWRRVLGWFGSRWPARCGYIGAVVGILVGTIANDSGAVLLVIGTIYLAVCAGFAWAQRPQMA